MTIDEAQTMLNAKAKCIERICKGIYEDCNEQKCDNCDLCYAQGTNGEQIELMLQCAEWLEELKVIKEMDLSIPQHFTKEQSDWIKKYCINRNKEFYNKALDDFLTEICKMIVQSENNGNYRFYAVEIKQSIADLAEKLKGKYNEQRNNNR